MRCIECGLASFKSGHHCNCPVGSPSPAAFDSAGRVSHLSTGEGLPTTDAYERRTRSVADEMLRIRQAVEALADDDSLAPDAVEAKIKAYRLVAQMLDMERKAANDLHGMGRERELPEIADRMERTVAKSRERKGRLTGAEVDEN
jgi:hypothetical protein